MNNLDKIVAALEGLRPGAEWTLTGDTLDGLVWHDQVQLRPTDAEITAYTPKVMQVTALQARLALANAGLLDQVQAAVTAAGGPTLITWQYAQIFERNNAMIVSLSATIGLTSDQLDQLFAQAALL